ncbi:MAG: oxygenase MpaB family protein [bacterium]|nr:oxygenase MpaB family protein [bacterium]
MKLPTDYDSPGVARARQLEPEMAENYLAHTLIGDPVADTAVEALAALDRGKSSRLIAAFVNSTGPDTWPDAPPAVRELFVDATTQPDWLDLAALAPGVRMFHRNTKLVLASMVAAVLVEGFASNISQSFFITGRLRDQGVRRLQQNNRHMVEIFFPGGMESYGDGWKLSVRIRLVHAHVRRLLANSEDWDTPAWGVPLSAAHVGYAITAFSARLLQHIRSVGARFSAEEAAGFMATWRYSGHLMGIPDSILYRDEAEALRLFAVGLMCEPEPDDASVALANALVNSAPLVVGIDDPTERRNLAKYVYKVSRAMIGDSLADKLRYPKQSSFGVLGWFRFQGRYERVLQRCFPKLKRQNNFTSFTTLLSGSRYDDEGITYRMPDHVHAERSSDW